MTPEIKRDTIARTICLLIALANQGLALAGKNVIPIADETVYQAISYVFTAVAALIAWWKNNSFTVPARLADQHLESLRDECKS